MSRSSRGWLLIAFAIAFVGVGFRYWQMPYEQLDLPDALYGPGLAAVLVVAMMVRAFGVARFWIAWLVVASAVPAAVLVRIALDTASDPASHSLWPFEILVAAGIGLVAALAGALLGSLFLLRSSRRP